MLHEPVDVWMIMFKFIDKAPLKLTDDLAKTGVKIRAH